MIIYTGATYIVVIYTGPFYIIERSLRLRPFKLGPLTMRLFTLG